MFAVVRVRGNVKVTRKIKETLSMLRLKRINHCVLIENNPSMAGMLQKAKDFITWGEIKKEIQEKLEKKRKEKDSKIFRLSPPSGGYKSTKIHFPKGDLGFRGEKINELLEKMI